MSRPQIHQFHIRAAEGSAHKSLILAQRLLGEIKQRQAASPSRDGAADKDLSMAHFHGTEGRKEGGREKGELKQLWKGVQSRGPGVFQRKLDINKQASPTETCSSKAGCPARNLGNGADSSERDCYPQTTFPRPPPPPKKTFPHQPVSLAEVQKELYWRSPRLMILRIYKNTQKPCMERHLSSEQIPRSQCHKLKENAETCAC